MEEEREKKPRAKPVLPSLKEGDVVSGKYRIERLLGCGGMAAVFSAVHTGLEHRVAIKTLLPEVMKHESIIERFAREARSVAKLQSEHVARVIDVGELPDGAPFLVMEYLEGTDLSGMLKKRGPLPVREVADIAIQACEGIAEAHALGIVHRDLKPANLFITTRADGERVVKVLDFGVAKTLSGPLAGKAEFDLTHTFDVVGSPHYMSPEQVTCAKEVDARADIWAMGVVLHRLLTARPAFDGKSFAELCMAILQHEPRSLRTLRPDVPDELVAVVLKCLAKRAVNRYARIGELADALRPFLDHETTALTTVDVPKPPAPRVEPGSQSGSRSGSNSGSQSSAWKSRSQVAANSEVSFASAPVSDDAEKAEAEEQAEAAEKAEAAESATVVPLVRVLKPDATVDVELGDLVPAGDDSQSVAPWRAITTEKLEGTQASPSSGRKNVMMITGAVVVAAALIGTMMGVIGRPSSAAPAAAGPPPVTQPQDRVPTAALPSAEVASPTPAAALTTTMELTDTPAPVAQPGRPVVGRGKTPPAVAPAVVSAEPTPVAPVVSAPPAPPLPAVAAKKPPPPPPRNPLSMDLKDM